MKALIRYETMILPPELRPDGVGRSTLDRDAFATGYVHSQLREQVEEGGVWEPIGVIASSQVLWKRGIYSRGCPVCGQ